MDEDIRQYLIDQYGWETGLFEFEIEDIISIIKDFNKCTGT
jgi:hypothetical protein